MANKSTMFSLRLDDDIANAISSYAKRNSTTKAAALNHYARVGIESELNPNSQPATRADLLAMSEAIRTAIKDQPIAIQQSLPAPVDVASEKESAVESERQKIASMGFFERRRYLRDSS